MRSKNRKSIICLKEARETFEPGHMRDIMDESIGHLEAGHSYSEKSVLRESLDIVEKEYECRKIKTLHELLISAEEYGGEADDSISLLLMMWNYGNAEVTCFREKRKSTYKQCGIHCCGYSLMCRNFIYVKCTSGYP